MKLFILLVTLSLSSFAQEEESEAMRALRLACQQNSGLGCYNYANMLLKRNDQQNAEKYFEMGCKLEHSDSCLKKSWDSTTSATTTSESSSAPVDKAPVVVKEESFSEVSEPAQVTSEETEDTRGNEGETEATLPQSTSENPSTEETELDLSAIE